MQIQRESGASRLLNSMIVAVCLAPLLCIGAMFMLGWNEKRSVCDQNAIREATDVVSEVPCTASSTSNGGLVMFSCDIDKESAQEFTLPGTDFASASYKGTGFKTVTKMLQCVETRHDEKHKTGGGGTETRTTYTYSTEWVDHYVDSGDFKMKYSTESGWSRNCGVDNPAWPAGLPETKTAYASQAKVGPFTIPKTYVQQVPLDTAVSPSDFPVGWKSGGAEGTYSTTKWVVPGGNGIGQVTVAFKGNNWKDPMVTVLGSNSDGTIAPWKAPATWLCSGSMIQNLKPGRISKVDLFADMANAASVVTWVLRILGFGMMWFACSRFAAPLGVVADCIPCVGPWIGDKVETVACCITCFPACACCLGIIGVVWVAMRPMLGIPLMLIFFATLGAGLALKIRSQQRQEQSALGQPARELFMS